ncbi:MAG: YggS family pyridoxal phosphate-dependent enzyme [Planctomycetota bacterium]
MKPAPGTRLVPEALPLRGYPGSLMETTRCDVAANLARVQSRMAAAARRAGRDPAGVTLVAVTKSAPASSLWALHAAGVRDIGESRVQQAVARQAEAPPQLTWHLVGHLQSNKVRRAVATCAVLHAVDSLSLLEQIEAEAVQLGRRPLVFLQVNVSGESTKHGLQADTLPQVLTAAAALSATRLLGLMTMAPNTTDSEQCRSVFRELADSARLHASRLGLAKLALSMGMSNDYEIAIEEGATHVRVGRALFSTDGGASS